MEGISAQETVKPLLSSILTPNQDGVDREALTRVTGGEKTKFVVDGELGSVLADNTDLLHAVLGEPLIESIDL